MDLVPADEMAQLEDLIVVHDNKGKEIPFEKLDKDSYNGFIYVLKDGTTKQKRGSMEKKIKKINNDKVAKEIVRDKIYRAKSLRVIDEIADPDTIDYIEPDYIMHAMDDIAVKDDKVGAKSTNDTYYSNNKWAYDLMDMDTVWNKGITGSGKNGNSTFGGTVNLIFDVSKTTKKKTKAEQVIEAIKQ